MITSGDLIINATLIIFLEPFMDNMLTELQIFLMCYRYPRNGILQMTKGQVFWMRFL